MKNRLDRTPPRIRFVPDDPSAPGRRLLPFAFMAHAPTPLTLASSLRVDPVGGYFVAAQKGGRACRPGRELLLWPMATGSVLYLVYTYHSERTVSLCVAEFEPIEATEGAMHLLNRVRAAELELRRSDTFCWSMCVQVSRRVLSCVSSRADGSA